jgi:hypothetical protein
VERPPHFAFAVAVAVASLVVIPEGNLRFVSHPINKQNEEAVASRHPKTPTLGPLSQPLGYPFGPIKIPKTGIQK